MDGQTEGQMVDEWLEGWMKDRWMMDVWVDGWVGVGGYANGWIDGWTDGKWMSRPIDSQMGE